MLDIIYPMDFSIGFHLMILYDASHTAHSSANSGIQHVTRMIHTSIRKQTRIVPVCFDPYAGFWRKLDWRESRYLTTNSKTKFKGKRNSQWSFASKLKGMALKMISSGLQRDTHCDTSFLTAEIFSPSVYTQYPRILSMAPGPRVAVFHDAIALRLPRFTPKKTCLRIPQYMMELLDFDGVAAVSESSADDLRDYWKSRAVPLGKQPVIRTIPNASSFTRHRDASGTQPGVAGNEILMVSTIEGRKNHLGLLKAAKILWDQGLDFSLRIIGGLNPQTGSEAHQMIVDLSNRGYAVHWCGAVSNAELIESYKRCRFTVYPSFWEGFGLPVVESLSLGKPCVCTSFGALQEVAGQGGCLVIEDGEPGSIASGMRRLILDDALLGKLAGEANERSYRSWDDHAGEILDFIDELKATAPRFSSNV